MNKLNKNLIHSFITIFALNLIFSFSTWGGEYNEHPAILKKIQQKVIRLPDEQLYQVVTYFFVNVPSSGCTSEALYSLSTKEQADAVVVEANQRGEDFCKGFFPGGKDLILKTDRIAPYKKIHFKSGSTIQTLPVEVIPSENSMNSFTKDAESL